MTAELVHAAEVALDYLTGAEGAHAAEARELLARALAEHARHEWRALPLWWCDTHKRIAEGDCLTDPDCRRMQTYVGNYDT